MGVLVLRVWTETDESHGIRARITTRGEHRANLPTMVAGGSVEEVVDLVRPWVLDFVGGRQTAERHR